MLSTTRVGLRGAILPSGFRRTIPCSACLHNRRPRPPIPSQNRYNSTTSSESSTTLDPSSSISSTTPSPVSTTYLSNLPLPEPLLHPIDTLSQVLLAIPESVPLISSYGTTIIIVALLVRSGITLPITLWQRARFKRSREIVKPEMERINSILAGKVARECRKAGLGYEAYKKELKRQMTNHQAALHKLHKTHPTITLILPLAVHIPILILMSLTIRNTLELPGSVMAAEQFWWFDNLGSVDYQQILPILGGVLSFGNAELVARRNRRDGVGLGTAEGGGEGDNSSRGDMGGSLDNPGPNDSVSYEKQPPTSTVRRIQLKPTIPKSSRPLSTSSVVATKPPKLPLIPRPSRPSLKSSSTSPNSSSDSTSPNRQGKPGSLGGVTPSEHLTPVSNTSSKTREKIIRQAEARSGLAVNALRIGAILFVPIASQIPAGLALYWVTSISFTFFQSLILGVVDQREVEEAAKKGLELTNSQTT